MLCRFIGIPYKVKWIPPEQSFVRFDPELGWSYIPNSSNMHKTGNLTISVYFNKDGVRVSRPDFQIDYARPSVLFVGGSITMGHGLNYKDSFVGKFASFEGVHYQVLNLGVQAYGTDQSLLALKKFLSKFNTKVVVYDFTKEVIERNGNYDRRQLLPEAKFLGTKPLFAVDDNNKLYLAKKPKLYKDYINSYLFDFIKMKLGSMRGTFPPFPEELTKTLILEMKRFSEKHGAHFVVINWKWNKNDYDKLFDDIDVNVIDTMDNAPEGWQEMVLFEGSHPDARASAHVAKLLLEYFSKNNLLNINSTTN